MRRGWILLAVGGALAVVFACGDPADPVIPPPPGTDDGGGATECFGKQDGTACENGAKVCVNSVCSVSACGDGFVTAPEECDLGSLNGVGAGCEPNCRFSCAAGDATRDCKSTDPCVDDGVCDGTKHQCTLGQPKTPGSPCGNGGVCRGTTCEPGQCGDAVASPPEQCDNGTANGPKKGCESDCKFTCSDPATDCTALPCNVAQCAADHTCTNAPDTTKNSQGCGAGLVCKDGACIAPGATCGNAATETGEECDFGAKNGATTGCTSICRFSCHDDCVDQNPCHEAPSCNAVTVDGHPGKQCAPGATKPDGAACGVGSICLGGTCKLSSCGDGFRDDTRGEECDDGNVTNLDACDSTCKFEQDHRVVSLKLQFTTDAYCTVNALGGAIGFLAQSSFQGSIDSGIKDGSVSPLLAFYSGSDLAGATGTTKIGSLSGDPTTNAPPYDGTNDLEWWYAANATHINSSRRALAELNGTFANGQLDATGNMNLIVSVGAGLANLAVSDVKLKMAIGAVSTPKSATGNAPPGHVTAEHLKSLVSFETGDAGRMCGNVSAASLDRTPVPSDLLPGGGHACNEKYGDANRLLDVLVHGCHVTGVGITAIKATQPDQVDSGAPGGGAGGPYVLAVDSAKRVTSCKDKGGGSVTLQTCLAAAAYSISFKYQSHRVIIK